jgi:tetratricopeptide (TPR) repeat protein
MQLALLSDRAGDTDLAIAQYRAILASTPNDGAALNNLAYLLAVSRNQPQQALPLAERAVLAARLDPELLGLRILSNDSMLGYEPELLVPISLDTLAWVQHLLGRSADAAKSMREARAAGGESAEILWHAAVIYAAIDDAAHAGTELQAAIASDPSLANRVEVQKLRRELIGSASPTRR